jgi:HSP20 family protein
MAETLSVKKTKSVFDQIERMHDRVMRRAHEIFSSNGGFFGNDLEDWLQAERELVWKPAIELEERNNEFHLKLAAPGVEPKDLDIEVTPEVILVKAEVRHEHEEDSGVYACEFASGNLFRSIHLPKKIDAEQVKAEFKNGILTLKAPVAVEARAKKVAIEAA